MMLVILYHFLALTVILHLLLPLFQCSSAFVHLSNQPCIGICSCFLIANETLLLQTCHSIRQHHRSVTPAFYITTAAPSPAPKHKCLVRPRRIAQQK